MKAEEKYLIYKFILSEIARQTDKQVSDFGMLTRMKLLFFFCTLSGEDRRLFFTYIFNSFYATPMGPVETEVSDIEKVEFFIESIDYIKYREKLVEVIQQIVANNCSAFKHLVKFNGIELSSISQNFISWRKHFLIARLDGRREEKMSLEYLINEPISL